jgi:hypothetical protein
MVHFIMDAVGTLDLSTARVNERGTGSAQNPCGAKKVSRTGLMVDFKGFTGIELGDGFKDSVLGLHARRLA